MSLLASALGGVGGLLGGLIPEVTGYFKKKLEMKAAQQDHEMEMERLRFSLDSDIKKLEIEHQQEFDRQSWNQVIEEDKNFTSRINSLLESQVQETKGLPTWVRIWNAVLRPTFLTINIGIFTIAACVQMYVIFSGVGSWEDVAALESALKLLWANEIISGSISGSISFLIGYRSARKLPTLIR